jgi:hypothetical protein
MANTISSTTPVNQSYLQPQQQQTKAAAKTKTPESQDTVQLSQQAKTAAADSDHDGR